MRKILLLLASAAIVASCSSNEKSSSSNSAKSDSGVEAKAGDEKPEVKKNWTFETDTDKMTSKKVYFASVDATNKLEFDSPYDGGSTASLILRNKDKADQIMLKVDKGQFICGITDGCAINVRFDNQVAVKFKASAPSDGSSTVLFIEPEKKFIKKLKAAKKMIVQAEFYESGLKTMEFDVDGFKWDY